MLCCCQGTLGRVVGLALLSMAAGGLHFAFGKRVTLKAAEAEKSAAEALQERLGNGGGAVGGGDATNAPVPVAGAGPAATTEPNSGPTAGGAVGPGPAAGPAPAVDPHAGGKEMIDLTMTVRLFERMSTSGDVAFVDARVDREFVAGRIPFAKHLTPDLFGAGRIPDVLSEIPKENIVVVYCGGGACDASNLVRNNMIALGYKDVFIFKDGFPAWQQGGHPVQSGQ